LGGAGGGKVGCIGLKEEQRVEFGDGGGGNGEVADGSEVDEAAERGRRRWRRRWRRTAARVKSLSERVVYCRSIQLHVSANK
jgi:hypothetical protein